MSQHSLPEDETPTEATAEPVTETASASPLEAAASQGALHWPSDPEVDPEGAPDPALLNDATQEQDLIAFNLRR